MKKIILTLACFGYQLVSQAQNTVVVEMGEGLCLSYFEITLNDNSTQVVSPGCTGTYGIDLGDLDLQFITVNDVVCRVNEEKEVTVDNGKNTRVATKGTRISFGGGTTSTEK